jgi:hypothetical protein
MIGDYRDRTLSDSPHPRAPDADQVGRFTRERVTTGERLEPVMDLVGLGDGHPTPNPQAVSDRRER